VPISCCEQTATLDAFGYPLETLSMSKRPSPFRLTIVLVFSLILAVTGSVLTASGVNAAGERFAFLSSVGEIFGLGSQGVQPISEPTPVIESPLATAVPMASQSGLIYTENFADIANWTDGFASGIGASRWGGLPTNGTGTIPDGVRISTQTEVFPATGSSGGVQRGSLSGNPAGTIVLLSTGATDNTTSAAIDLFLNYSGVLAGTLSFDWASVNNSTGDRKGSLRIYTSTNGTTFTELASAAVLNFTNNSATSGSITNVSLPSGFNGSSTAQIRFYFHNGTGGTTGSRPKISLDNVRVTATNIAPTTQASNITFSSVTTNSMTVNWTNGNGSKRIVKMNTTNTFDAPADGTDPSANATYGGSGQQVVYNGTGSNVAISGLSASTNYHFRVYEANGSGATSVYNTATATDNPRATATVAPPTASVTGSSTICAGGSGTVTVTVSGGVAPYTVVLTNGGGTQSGAGPTFNFPVSPGSTTGYTLAAGSVDASSTAITTGDTATITVNQPPTPSNAGPDQTVVGSTATLAGNTPSVGTGTWSIVAGVGGSFTSPNNPNSDFTGLPGFIYTLRWTISNAPCSSSTNDVVITLNKASTSLANLTVNSTELVGNSLAVSTTLTRTSPPPGVVAGEMVTFTLTGPSPSGTISNLSGTTNGSGSASVNFPLTARGAYTINASYAGNSTLNSSTSNTPSVSVYQRSRSRRPAVRPERRARLAQL